jgi:predicted nucleic acid-binding Zn ribbon protein
VGAAEPATLLARVQSAWPTAAGDVLAAEAQPVSERDGVVTVRCSSSLWASELGLMGADLAASLNAEMSSGDPASPVCTLRFVTGA